MSFPFFNFWKKKSEESSNRFIQRSTKDFVAIFLTEGQQEELGTLFPETLPTAEKVGQYNLAVEKTNDYWPRQEKVSDSLKRFIWLISFLCAAGINIRILQAATPEQLEQYGLSYPVMFLVSGSLVLLVDHIIDTELSAYLLRQEAERVKSRLKMSPTGIFSSTYHEGRRAAFKRVQAQYLSKLSLLSKGKLTLLVIIAIAEYGAAISNAIMTNELERFGIFALFSPLVGVMLTGMSGLFKASMIDYPYHKKAVAHDYYDIAGETENKGELEEKVSYANTVAKEFANNPDFTREDLEKAQQQTTAKKLQQEFFNEVKDRRQVLQEGLVEQNETLNNELAEIEKKESLHLGSSKKAREFQLQKNFIHRRYYRARLNLIQGMLSDLMILRSSYSCELIAYEQFKAELEQQKLNCEKRLEVLIKEYQACNGFKPAPGNQILSFSRQDKDNSPDDDTAA